MIRKRTCIFGEVLFDHFPNGTRVLGGAPFNVAWHLQAFGKGPLLCSRIGNDPDGASITAAMREWDMDTCELQLDPALATGRVEVTISGGEPAYDILWPCAWDAIDPPARRGDIGLLYHGSLALRETRSRSALEHIRQGNPPLVFIDVNLRAPWWRREAVLETLRGAHWVKLSAEELAKLAGPALDAPGFLRQHALQGLIVTHGARGAELFRANGERLEVRPPAAPVADTVGAGDAFAAVMILGLLEQWPHGLALQRAQGFASAVVGVRGATVRERAFYRPFVTAWNCAN